MAPIYTISKLVCRAHIYLIENSNNVDPSNAIISLVVSDAGTVYDNKVCHRFLLVLTCWNDCKFHQTYYLAYFILFYFIFSKLASCLKV